MVAFIIGIISGLGPRADHRLRLLRRRGNYRRRADACTSRRSLATSGSPCAAGWLVRPPPHRPQPRPTPVRTPKEILSHDGPRHDQRQHLGARPRPRPRPPGRGPTRSSIATVVAVLVVVAVVVAVALGAAAASRRHPARPPRPRPPCRCGATGPGGGIVVNPGKAGRARPRWTSTRTSSARSAAVREAARRTSPGSLAAAGNVKLIYPHHVLPRRQPAQRLLPRGPRTPRSAPRTPASSRSSTTRSSPSQPAKRARATPTPSSRASPKTAGITGGALSTWQQCVKTATAHGVRQVGPDPEREGRRVRAPRPSSSTARSWTCRRSRPEYLTARSRPRRVSALTQAALPATIPSPAAGVWHLGRFPVRVYAMCILAGIVARGLAHRPPPRPPAAAQPGQALDVAAWAVPFGIVGGRLYHVITTPGSRTSARAATRSTPSRSGRAAWASGAPSRSARSAPGSAAAARGVQLPAPSPTRRARRRGRPGHRPVRQLVQQRALRRAARPCRGAWRSTSGTRRRATRSGDAAGKPSSSASSSRPSSTSRSGASWCSARAARRRRAAVRWRPGSCSGSTWCGYTARAGS